MSCEIRTAEPRDIPAIIAFQLHDANIRKDLSPRFWAMASDASEKMIASLSTISDPLADSIRHHWIVAERAGSVIGVMHGMNIPTPPVYEARGGEYAGVIADDSHVPPDPEVAAALLKAIERALRETGAGVLVAASPADWKWRTEFFIAADYMPTTSYMLNDAFAGAQCGKSSVRCATEADVDGIVKLSALHRADLEAANPDFWKVHPEADMRFGWWMRMSLGLQDRSMFVAGENGHVDGFVIAQPASPLHLSAAHDSSRLGLIDDFCARAFHASSAATGRTGEPLSLLSAAEASFQQRGLDAALVVCPVRMTAKAELLSKAGYRATNLWLTKRETAI